jgi:FlaA1/EpsC-like NDP-sugar epimerase
VDSRFSDNLWFLRRPVQFLADIAVLSAAFFLAFLPAINIQLSDYNYTMALTQVPFVVFVQFSALFLVGSYSMIWRYVSIPDLKVFLKAALISGSILLALRFLLTYSDFRMWQVPISVILIDTVLGFGGLLGLRVMRRVIYELGEKNPTYSGRRRYKRKPTLIVGAGRMGATLAKEMTGRADAELEIRGFVDDDQRKKGGRLGGLKVLGTTEDLARLVDELSIEQVVIAIDSAQ